MDGEAVTGHRRRHRVADAAGNVVVLDRDQTALVSRAQRTSVAVSTGCTL
jgi:hypothetical protein